MRHKTALKVKVGNIIHLKPELGARSYTVTEIDYGPGSDPHVKYPLFKIKNDGLYSYLLVRIAQKENGEVIV